jgi:hypothetical protein
MPSEQQTAVANGRSPRTPTPTPTPH